MANYPEDEEDMIREISAMFEDPTPIDGQFYGPDTTTDPVDDFLAQMHLPEDEAAEFQPAPQPAYAAKAPQARVYNRDYVNQKPSRAPVDTVQMPRQDYETPEQTPPKRKKRRHGFLGKLIIILALIFAAGAAFWFLYPKRPDGAAAAAKREDVSTILIAGTDQEGYRTDTMMLLYLNNDTKQVNLLSIPRDTRVVVDGDSMKLNAVYGYGGQGEKGMRLLMEELDGILGFEPDAYVLLDFDGLAEIIDIMGGIEFDVPCDMYYDDPAQDLHIDLSQGLQTLDGEEAVHVLRYRSGYALADLQRVNVQRDMVKAAMNQWLTPGKLFSGLRALGKLGDCADTDLSARNLFWVAKTIYRIGLGGMESYTLPGSWDSPYYWLDTQQCADILDEYFNPTDSPIRAEDLTG